MKTESLESLRVKANTISDQIDNLVRRGGRVGLNDPLSRQLREVYSKIAKVKRKG
jgi:hypothetical protein